MKKTLATTGPPTTWTCHLRHKRGPPPGNATPSNPGPDSAPSTPTGDAATLQAPNTASAPQPSMRRLEVMRASTRQRPTHDDPVDTNLVPDTLAVTMNDGGSAHYTIGHTDPSALDFTQLSTIADQAHHACPGGTEDFIHLAEDPFAVSQAYAYAASSTTQHGFLEETSQVVKIPSTYAEAMDSPQCKEWKGACATEMDTLRKYNVYTLVPLDQVPKGDKILATQSACSRRSWTDASRLASSSEVIARNQDTTTDEVTPRYAASGATACYWPLHTGTPL